jgi:hypothetical protein
MILSFSKSLLQTEKNKTHYLKEAEGFKTWGGFHKAIYALRLKLHYDPWFSIMYFCLTSNLSHFLPNFGYPLRFAPCAQLLIHPSPGPSLTRLVMTSFNISVSYSIAVVAKIILIVKFYKKLKLLKG